MNKNMDTIGSTMRRELVRAILERAQSTDLMTMVTAAEEKETIQYDDVEETLNIPYINREEIPLAMDVFKPVTEEDVDLPVIVTIHGGGLTMGDRRLSRPFSRLLAHKGYLVFSVEYRLAPRANICQELDDVCAGLDFIGLHLVNYNVDFNRIFLAAESAGAYLAAYVAAMRGSEKLQEAIGYKAGRLRFKALGLNSGMFYTNRNDPSGWLLSDQIYGDRRTDENFLQYMNPEHPEIINNLPPVFLTTSRGDFLNQYTLMMHDALKKAGRTSRLIYYPDQDLSHAFIAMQTDHPSTLDAIDKMLAWFEEQAALAMKRPGKDPEVEARREQVKERIADGRINEQKIWQYILERNSIDPAQLQAPAIIDCSREYTYGQMFLEWERYAKVFSALGMTGENASRVGLAGTISAEPLFAFYALNRTGATVSMLSYPDFLPSGHWKTMVRKEKITDLILSDIMVTPAVWQEVQKVKEELGLRNVILLHSRLGGPSTGPAELIYNEYNAYVLRGLAGTVFMDDLISRYENAPIAAGAETADGIALITHTSGTTKGTRKPLPYTNIAVNFALSGSGNGFHPEKAGDPVHEQYRYAPSFDYSSFLSICSVCGHLAAGNTIVLTFFGFLHPKFIRAFDYHKINICFGPAFLLDQWIKRSDLDGIDLSSLKIFACGGSYIPPDKLRQYKDFMRRHGYKGDIMRGYGMSEAGGAELVVPPGSEEDILGYPRPVENVMIQDENDQQFYYAGDGVRTGIMYIASSSLCGNELDGEKLFDFTEINGKNFICTNDLVRVNENGSISYAGRADRYFVNNEGIRFDAGIVEAEMTRHPSIDRCAVVPVLDKRIHDTVPVLYVIPAEKGSGAEARVRGALIDLYISDGKISATNLPSQFVVVDEIPCNSNGKIDIYRITRERLKGIAFNIVPVRDGDRLTDIRIERTEQLSSITAGTLPEGMGTDSAFNVFELFNSSAPGAAKTEADVQSSRQQPAAFQAFMPFMPFMPFALSAGRQSGLPGTPSPFSFPAFPFSFFEKNKSRAENGNPAENQAENQAENPTDKRTHTGHIPDQKLMKLYAKIMGKFYGHQDFDRYFES